MLDIAVSYQDCRDINFAAVRNVRCFPALGNHCRRPMQVTWVIYFSQTVARVVARVVTSKVGRAAKTSRRRRGTRTREVQRSRRVARDLSQDAIMANRHSAYSSLQSEDEEASYYSAPSRVVHRMPSDVTDYGDGYLAARPLSGGTSGSSVSSRSLPEPPQVRTYVYLNLS